MTLVNQWLIYFEAPVRCTPVFSQRDVDVIVCCECELELCIGTELP